MQSSFTLDYWIDDNWYVGKIREVPGVFSQGETLEELKDNIKDALYIMLKESSQVPVKEFMSTKFQMEIT
ncbi:MAG: type II toxin-antitoxin system HicB family antitoxin [Bacteroidota bacterium]|nr:type II toxin-antitoxin system HicB family antitoxin [Bacteroidota bacterium]